MRTPSGPIAPATKTPAPAASRVRLINRFFGFSGSPNAGSHARFAPNVFVSRI